MIAERKDGQIPVIVGVHLRKVDLKKKILANERQLRPLAVVTLSLVPFLPFPSRSPTVGTVQIEREKKEKG